MSTLEDLAAGKLQPVYLLYGSEPAPIREHLQAVRAAVLSPGTEAFNHERFAGRELDGIGRVLEACAQLPMMADHRLVELSDPEAVGKGKAASGAAKAALDALTKYIAAPSPTTVLVISSFGIDGRSRLVGAMKKKGLVALRFEALKRDTDAVSWLLEHAKRHDIALSRRSAMRLVGLVGTGSSDLTAALDRASLYAGAGVEVDNKAIDAVVQHTREAVIFELTDAVGMGDAPAALAVLAQLFHDSPVSEVGLTNQALSMLIRQIRLVFAARFAGTGRGRIEAVVGVPPFVAKKLGAQARGFSEARLRRAYAGLARFDRDLKGGSPAVARAPYVALQRWILDVCGALPGVAPRV
ncbi:MAG: DNA polymerase III subunit delta [Myxococcota bacterium]